MMTPARLLLLRLLATLIFFASGAAGMVYEISWSRQFGNVFGHTVYTSAIVLSSFLGGMAIGYWLAGRYRGNWQPLMAYGVLEIGAGLWALLVPFALQAAAGTALGSLDPGPANLYVLLRVLFSFAVLLPCTIALGATWPMMAAFLSPRGNPAPQWLSWGYATNTAGAMIGSVLATAYLLVQVGVTSSSLAAAGVSIACGLIALVLHAAIRTETTSSNKGCIADLTEKIPLRWWLLVGLSGFSVLALEVLYMRLFSLVFHNSTYTFGIVVTVFLLALAIGSALTGFVGSRVSPALIAALACGAGGVCIVLSLGIFRRLTNFDYVTGESFQDYLFVAFRLVVCVVLPPITALGMILPIAWRAIEPRQASESQVAGLTAVSTIAGACGSLAASFALPLLGLWGSFGLLIAVYLLLAAAILIALGEKWLQISIGVIAVVAIEFNWHSMSTVKTLEPGEQLLQRWESAYGWIDAIEQTSRRGGSSRTTQQNLHYGFGDSHTSVQRDYRQGHLPLLLQGHAQDVAFLGMGTGQTAAAAIPHEELKSIVVVELIPEAVQAARYLSETNRGLVDHPRVEIQVNDARRFLSGSGRQFDVIVSDLFVPWESHTGYLYTVEHYRAAKKSLRPGGLFCQWLALYQMGPAEFEAIANSFASVFPNTTLWWVRPNPNSPVLGLIGTEQPIPYLQTAAAKGWLEHNPHTGEHDPLLADEQAILSFYIGDWHVSPRARFNTDEHPIVEFSAPVSHGDNRKLRGEAMQQYFQTVLAKLPQQGVNVEGVTGPAKDHAWRLQQQRQLLGIAGE
ncbi:fused MFS/spermidine synthase [Anatilimnocola sp. NA78]|uniref:fused MFS/spermidine synthase n=1 Tax=Anatilimnocola sp. NA78 TaxID=3415683 RepID=UPI003CE47662